MNKLITLLLVALTEFANAQFVPFKFDSLEWKLNGKSIPLTNSKLQVDVKDTSGLIVLGTI